jgi:hypothetical protein
MPASQNVGHSVLEAVMFIFRRSLQAVLAGLAVAFLVVTLDHCAQPAEAGVSGDQATVQPASACAAHHRCGIVRAGS